MTNSRENSLTGCMFEPPRTEAQALRFDKSEPVLTDQTLPQTVDLRPHCTAVEAQGEINSCTANAAVGALEYLYHKRDGAAPELSRMFVYFNTRRLNGTILNDGGARISEAMAAVLAFGACREELWPYAPQLFAQQPPQQVYLDAMGHEALQFARVPGIDGAVRALASGLPVVFGTCLPKRCYDEAAQTGRMPATTAQERSQSAPPMGHAMLLVGYDLDAKELLVRNSWGPGWGDGGYCRLGFGDAMFFSPPDGFWTLMTVEPRPGLKLVSPDEQRAELAATNPAYAAALGAAPHGAPGEASGAATGFGAPAAAPGDKPMSASERLRAEIRGELEAGQKDLSNRIANLRESLGGGTGPDTPAPSPAQPPTPPVVMSASDALGSTPCGTCNGQGFCWYCGASRNYSEQACNHCYGSGRCATCGGQGVVW